MEKNYPFNKAEKEMQNFWQENDIYKFDRNDGREIYSIDTPPPTVSGSLHIGHIFSYAQAEMIARYKRMQGYNVFYPFGFDDNGLPTERLVERDEGIVAKDLPRSEFIQKCADTTEQYVSEFVSLWKSLGFSVDWSLQYSTVSPLVQRISQRSFLDLVQKGKAYMKKSPVLWCVECQTSIAQAELDGDETETDFVYIPFMVGKEPLTVATTRPELLYGCVCLFINPNDSRAMKLTGKTALTPLYNIEIPILTDEKVSMEKGTGIVMCATFGDSTDAQWYMEHHLPYREVIMPNGLIHKEVPFIGGLPVHAARRKVIGLLEDTGMLIRSERMVHSVATHERCGTEIEIIPSEQWYIDILRDKALFLEAADQINWYPAYMKSRYISWVNNLKWDWCISRQRYFGVPLPVWYCRDCGEPAFAKQTDLPVNPLETSYNGFCTCGCDVFIPENAVLDTWATSSVTPLINAKSGESDDMSDILLPMSMRTQAHEIIRTWAFYTIVRSLYHTGSLPWRDIMICGFVLAKKGEKISKSKSNSELSPAALIEKHSADVIRYWAANAKLGTDTFFSADDLSVARRFIIKLWNAAKFAIPHLQDIAFDNIPVLLPVDRWIIERTNETVSYAAKLLDEYEIGAARHEMDELFWKDFCDYYLEIVKERLYQPELHGAEGRRSGQFALYYALFNILKLYAVYVPHITEYIYREFFILYEKTPSIHLLQWEKTAAPDDMLLSFGNKLKEVIADTRRHKSENNLSMKAEIDILTVKTTPALYEWFLHSVKDLKACTRARSVEILHLYPER